MLHRILYTFLLCFSGTLLYSQAPVLEAVPTVGTEKNWVSSISYDLSGTTISKTVGYFNFLGKPTQQQSWDKRTGRIWASEVRYDYFGRPALQTLSAPINATAFFDYKPDFIRSNNALVAISQYDSAASLFNPPVISDDVNTLGWYYSNSNTLDPFQDTTPYPYSRTVYSELNPGTAKAVLGGNKINGNWLQVYTFSMPMEKTSNLTEKFYDNFRNTEAVKTISRDVHGVETVSFSDTDGNSLGAARSGEGIARSVYSEIGANDYVDIHIPTGCGGTIQLANITNNHQIVVYDLITEQLLPLTINATNTSVVLQPGFYRFEDQKKYYGSSVSSLPAPVKISYTVNYYDLSKNQYDLVGRLIKSTQPLNVLTANELASTYSYDSSGNVISSSSPDEGVSEFKYRRDGAIRFSQSVEQKKANRFSYTNYDNLGRPVESGVYTGTELFFGMSDTYDGMTPLADSILEELDGLPVTGRSEQNFTVYDLPDPGLNALLAGCGIPNKNFVQTFVSGNVSYTYTQNPSTSKTWYNYDVFGKVKTVVQQVTGLDCLKTIEYAYNPNNGQVLKVLYQSNNTAEKFIHSYVYSVTGQLTDVLTSVDNTNFTRQAHYSYNESGELIRTELADDLQGIDYVYNLNGQLKAINHPSLTAANDPGNDGANGFASDVFGLALDYYSGDYTRTNVPKPITSTPQGINQYNGNIKASRWNTQIPSATQNAYTYQYNRNNWMTKAIFGSANSAALFTPNTDNDYLEGNISYDANGNILALQRNGYTGSGTNNMDNFQYVYNAAKPNQLRYVKDTGDNTAPARYADLKNQEELLPYTGSVSESQPNYIYNDLGQLVYNIQDNVGYEYNASGLVHKIKTNASTNTNDFFTHHYNAYNDPAASVAEKAKWTPAALNASIAFPFTDNDIDFCGELVTPDAYAMRLLGTQVASTKIRVVPNTFTKVDLDVIVDKYMFKEVLVHGVVTPSSLTTTDIIPTVKVRLKRANGTLIGTEQVVANRPADYCGNFFKQHLTFSYTSSTEEFITIEVETLKQRTPSGSTGYLQRLFVDNVKVQSAQRTGITFQYNERGHRVLKESATLAGISSKTYYLRDVAGSPLAVYTQTNDPNAPTTQLKMIENSIFGNSRIGVFKRDATLAEKGFSLYEITDHLGNVRAILRKTSAGALSVTGKADYYPFGMPMPNKQITDNNYRYAFQGQEKDPETGMEAFELRLWDGRLGRWLTTDPMGEFHSPYVGMGNNPINLTDPDGGMTDEPGDQGKGWFGRLWSGVKGMFDSSNNYKPIYTDDYRPVFQSELDNDVLVERTIKGSSSSIPCVQCHHRVVLDFSGADMRFANGLKNTTFGVVGAAGSGYYMIQTGGIGAAAGGSIAFTLSMGEIGIGIDQMADSFNQDEALYLHDAGTVPGLIFYRRESPYAPYVDGASGFIPGILSGPRIISSGNTIGAIHGLVIDLPQAKTASEVGSNSLQIIDGVLDSKGLFDGFKEVKDKK